MSGGPPGRAFAAVAVPIPARRVFTYEVPGALLRSVLVGSRVLVPFQTRRIVGTVVESPAPPPDPSIEVRPIEKVLDGIPTVPESVLSLTRFVSDYYLCSWGEAIEAALPAAPRTPLPPRFVRRTGAGGEEALPPQARARRRALEALPADGSPVPLAGLPPARRNALRELVRAGLAAWVEREEDGPRRRGVAGPPPLAPTPAQAAALDRLLPAASRREYAPFLLFGATGSGKTEVYLRTAEGVLASGRGVLYLVPEIGLTPLLLARISRRFEGDLAVLHSGLSAGERYRAWERIRGGGARFVLGARSAVFAPLPDPGLIVVDEEQDGSYKQEEAPRYHARDLAVVRAREEGALLLLGSATPSLESFRNARAGRYEILRLGERVESRPLAAVRIVDMRREFLETRASRPLSRDLVAELGACLARGEQALVLRNRRGWAPALHCPTCGERVSCSRCSLSLTWHRSEARLRCHYCALERPLPPCCPSCGAEGLNLLGEGTERIEEEIRSALPGARIERMDRDTVRRRGAHEAILSRFDRHEIDVLVGTQMIAKGHDFPRVTLVGVVSADQTLGLPDFRAAERTFQLLTQVAGRAGRGSAPGTVVVQAFDPAHPVLAAAAAQDYEAFYRREAEYRRALRYPPFSALVEIVVEDADPGRAAARAEILAEAVRREGEGRILVSGPGPAPIERLKSRWRRQILVRSSGRRRLVAAVDRALASVEREVPRKAILVDVDPVSLL